MTSVWFAASGSGEDGDEYAVHEVFATKEAAQAHCDRPDKPKWEHCYVQEWKVTGPILADVECEAISELTDDPDYYGLTRTQAKVLRNLLGRLK